MQTGEDEVKHNSRCAHVNGASGANIPAIVVCWQKEQLHTNHHFTNITCLSVSI